MPPISQRVLVLNAPRDVRFEARDLPAPGPDDVVLRSRFSTFKHGTEMLAYSGRSPFSQRVFDPTLRLFEETATPPSFYPRPLGNMVVGTLEWIGAEVAARRPELRLGASVYAWAAIADVHVLPAEKVALLDGLSPPQALCLDPATFALGGVLDGAIAAGETVLVTGLGAIGLLVVQYCKARGATVFAASSLAPRRKLAAVYGADEVFDPGTGQDVARQLKQRLGGVDVAIECSGLVATLNRAIRATRQCGRVVCVGYYGTGDTGINLGEEFYHNRLTLLASLPAQAWGNPVRGTPPLYTKDLQELIVRDFRQGTITPEGLFDPVLSFEQAERAVKLIADEPQNVIKVLLSHDDA
jgi:threonine dehydrogenase-like Zn-dependent dehydrogenase